MTPSSSMDESIHSQPPFSSAPSEPSTPNCTVKLQVGERWFTTTPDTLVSRSTYFEALLSSRWNTMREDGSYFIDSDPSLFEHILRYLRRPNVFPIFYDPAKGHDLVLYNSLLEEARYFGIDALVNWFEGEGYLGNVTVNHTVSVIDGEPSFPGIVYDEKQDPNTLVTFHPQLVPVKVYVCPRGLYVHRGQQWKCGNACRKAQGDGPPMYEEEMEQRIVVIKTTTTVGAGVDTHHDRMCGVWKTHGVNGPSLI
ncbi:hypothetical protein ASPVEDRAFT_41840 [Aspergillus versicolor CBS 583.65]|uniref:BTB domain-containing protein n=1 Tax=Aspergillus versicolor CBS 583.65 TaxID=1036611 RepID=A0A1L9PLI3_ASPVE|nr:uncharacterized protein ASPVEDRAFT_41840 [Aspergillus versicolor CBS 583.65]OJJ02343.1 hypothetical protein ASPVEDRAFT_41840 [Aspergillus versicolor CBS 583.65]